MESTASVKPQTDVDLEAKTEKFSEIEVSTSLAESSNDLGEAEKRGESETTDEKKNTVWWDEPVDKDPANPMNWPAWRKWSIISILSFITFLTPLASSMLAPGVPLIMADFHNDSTTFATFVVSIFILGFAVGPLFLAPLSEVYGRTPVYNTCNVCFVGFTILCAMAKDSGMLLAARFWAGLVGVATITCGSGSIADLMPREQRGRAMALWSVGPLMGPVIGPVVAGILVERRGWRYVFWVITVLSGFITIVAFLFLKETYAPVILERKAARLRKETGNLALRSKLTTDKTPGAAIKNSIQRPLKMLITFPVVTAMCIYIAFLYGAMYILFTTFTFVFRDQYNFQSSTEGLSFLGSGIGSFFGLGYAGFLSDRNLKRRQASGATIQPEDRLPYVLTVPAALSLPAGLFIYGWSAQYRIHWIVAEGGIAITSFGMLTIMMCISTYLVDSYTRHAASVTAANACLRSLLGALLPLSGLRLYDAVGLGWGNSILALIALMMSPLPILFRRYGARLRRMSDREK